MPKARDAGKTRYLSLVARILVAVVAILWVLHGQNWAELAGVFRRLSVGYFLLSLATFTAAQLVIALRWWLLLRAQTIHIAIPATVRLHFLGLFYNNVMPGSVGGDLLKAWYVTKHTDRRLAGALSVVVDRVVGVVGLVIMSVVAYLLYARGPLGGPVQTGPEGAGSWLGEHKKLIFWIIVGIIVACVVVLVQPYGRERLRQAAGRALRRGVGLVRGTWDAVLVYCTKPLTVLWATLLTFVAQSIVIVAFWLLGRNLGILAGLGHYFLIFPVMWVVSAVPISIAGLGVLEAGIVTLFVRLSGTAAEPVLALALCQRFIWVLSSLPGAVVHLLGAHLPREIYLDCENRVS